MSDEVTCKKVELFRVLPQWGGHKNLRISKIRAIQKGKTVYVPISMLGKWGRKGICESAEEAVAGRINTEVENEADEKKWATNYKAMNKALRDLLKATK